MFGDDLNAGIYMKRFSSHKTLQKLSCQTVDTGLNGLMCNAIHLPTIRRKKGGPD